VEGILLINKPKGFTSQDVVSKVKKILNIKKAGHTGTLDPMATGLLPVLINDYTKLSKYLIEHDKSYIVTLKFGIKTDTADIEGNVIEENPSKIDYEKIDEIVESFKGKSLQKPPMYSAIKINGKKLYEYARSGEKVDVPEREINIYDIKVIEKDEDFNLLKLRVDCSKGTYIRVLCEDIARIINTVATMYALERIKVDKFDIQNAITLEDLEKISSDEKYVDSLLIKMEDLFKEYPRVDLNLDKEKLFLNGAKLTLRDKEDGLYNVYVDNIYYGLGTIEKHILKRDIVIKKEE